MEFCAEAHHCPLQWAQETCCETQRSYGHGMLGLPAFSLLQLTLGEANSASDFLVQP